MSLFDDIESFLNNDYIKSLPNNAKASIGDDFDLGDLRRFFEIISDEVASDRLSNVDVPKNEIRTEIDNLQIQMRHILNHRVDIESDGSYLIDFANDMLFEIDDNLDAITENHKLSSVDNDDSRLKSYISNIEYALPEFPHMRKRRKQWGGKPTYRQDVQDINFKRIKGYSMRSMMYRMPKVSNLPFKELKSKMNRSISHVQLWNTIQMTGIETLKKRYELDLYSVHVEFCHLLFELEQEDTNARKDAWDTYLPSGLLDDFIADNYEPTLKNFSSLPSKVKSFIASAWDNYNAEARYERQDRYNMNLTSKQVSDLPNADTSIFEHQFGE